MLSGVKAVTIHDDTPASLSDLAAQFYITAQHVADGVSRCGACGAGGTMTAVQRGGEREAAGRAESLRGSGSVDTTARRPVLPGRVPGASLPAQPRLAHRRQCVVVVDSSMELMARVDRFCRTQTPPIKFVCASVAGVHGMVFSDFGAGFEVLDANGFCRLMLD